jgi:predicted ester cyclase
MSEANKALVRRFFEEMDKGNLGILDELVSPDYVYHFPGSPQPLDRPAHKESAGFFYEAFPDLRHAVEDQIAEGDRVVTRMTNRGTHRGQFMSVRPTGKETEIGVIDIIRISDCKIVEEWIQGDFLGLWQQIQDVTPVTVGIETRDGSFTPVIERNTSIPVRKTRIFTTVIDNQDTVEVHVLQRESASAEQYASLARFRVTNIPPAPRGVPQIEVTFEVDVSGNLHISAKEEASGYAVDRVIRHWASATPK